MEGFWLSDLEAKRTFGICLLSFIRGSGVPGLAAKRTFGIWLLRFGGAGGAQDSPFRDLDKTAFKVGFLGGPDNYQMIIKGCLGLKLTSWSSFLKSSRFLLNFFSVYLLDQVFLIAGVLIGPFFVQSRLSWYQILSCLGFGTWLCSRV